VGIFSTGSALNASLLNHVAHFVQKNKDLQKNVPLIILMSATNMTITTMIIIAVIMIVITKIALTNIALITITIITIMIVMTFLLLEFKKVVSMMMDKELILPFPLTTITMKIQIIITKVMNITMTIIMKVLVQALVLVLVLVVGVFAIVVIIHA
jgi:hypothetical protein